MRGEVISMGTVDFSNPAGQAILGLFRQIKEQVEEPDGDWPGADVVDTLTAWFTSLGLDPDKPAGEQAGSVATVTPATVGSTVAMHGLTLPRTVTPSCGSARGHWWCVTHSEGFAHQLAKDHHIATGQHVLAWMCAEHGPETP
jgi:hypothetical protein